MVSGHDPSFGEDAHAWVRGVEQPGDDVTKDVGKGCLAPEPRVAVVAGGSTRLLAHGVEIPGAKIVGDQPEALDIHRTVIGLFYQRSEMVDYLLQPKTRVRGRCRAEFGPRGKAADLVADGGDKRGLLGRTSSERDRTGPLDLFIGTGRVIGEVGEDDGTVSAFEQREGIVENSPLEVGFVGRAERAAELEGDPEETRQAHGLGLLTHERDPGGCDAASFEVVRDRADRAGAVRSDRHKTHCGHLIGVQHPGEVVAGRLDHLGRPPSAHERVVMVRDRTDHGIVGELAQSVEREHGVDVLAKAGSVEVDRRVCHRQLRGVRRCGNHAIAEVDKREGIVVDAVQPSSGDDGDPAFGKRWTLDPRRTVERRQFLSHDVLALGVAQVGQSYHALKDERFLRTRQCDALSDAYEFLSLTDAVGNSWSYCASMSLRRPARTTVTIPDGCRDHVVPMSDARAQRLTDAGVRQVSLSWLVAGFEWPGPDPITHLVLATVEGAGRLDVGERAHELLPGTVAVCPAHTPRCHATDQEWRVVTIRLADNDLWAPFRATGSFVLEGEDPHRFAAPTLGILGELTPAETAVTGGLSGHLPMETFRSRFGTRQPLDTDGPGPAAPTDPFSLYAVILRIQLESLLAGPPSISDEESSLHSLWEAVRREPGRDWSIPALARHQGVSPATLHRLVSRHQGSTPGAIVDRIRMNHAARLLAHGDLPVKAVATQVGYATPYSFSAAFRRIHGCPPSDFKTQAKRSSEG